MLFSEVLDEWWIGDTLNLRIPTIYKKRMVIDKHILPWFGDLDIKSIDDVCINKFIVHEKTNGNRLTESGLCHNSVAKEVNIIRNILDYALKKDYVKTNSSELVKRMRIESSREFEIFTVKEVQELIKVARPKWLGDMILLVYNTGMRKCEVYGLQWADINFDGKYLTVKRSVTANKPNDRYINEPKTRTSNRIILLDDKTLDMLRHRHNSRTSDTWVFASKYGDLLSPWYNVKYFRNACISTKIDNKRFYDLRHTHITELVESGIPLPIIQKRAGHADIRMTMHYTHIKPEMQQLAVDIINERNNIKK